MIRFAKPDRILNALLIINCFILAIFSLTGCGGSADIPQASELSSGRLSMSWMDVPGAASYDLYISTTPGVTTLNSYRISNVSTPLTITDLEPGTTYYFMITVFDDSGGSRNSREISYTVDKTEGSIDIGDLSIPDEPLDQSPSDAIAPVASSPQDRGAAPKTETPAAKKSAPVAIPKTAKPATKKTSQAVPSSLAGTRDVTVAWDNVPGANSYNIYWSDKPGVNRRNGTKIGNAKNPHTLKGLLKGKKYYFVVTAVNASGESRESEEFSFTVGQ